MEKFTNVLPAGMVTVAGTVTNAVSDVSVQVVATAATALSESVPVPLFPPAMLLGVNVSFVGTGALTTSELLAVVPPPAADMVTATLDATGKVEMSKLAVCAPEGTTTVAGTLAQLWELERLTVNPVPEAILLRLTVPTEDCPPVTRLGAMLSDVTFWAAAVSGNSRGRHIAAARVRLRYLKLAMRS
jgi:hypothetical protein